MRHKHHRKKDRLLLQIRAAVPPDYPDGMPDPETETEEISIAAKTMTIDSILEQMWSIRDNAFSFLHTPPAPDEDNIWTADIEAVDAVSAILSTLQKEGIEDAEQVKDLLFDYVLANEQLQAMHEKYEKPVPPGRDANRMICPVCRTRLNLYALYCHHCGKRVDTLCVSRGNTLYASGKGE